MGNLQPSIDNAEHIGPDTTGDNIMAKRVAGYTFDGTNWNRAIPGFFTAPYDELDWSNADGGGNYQTIVSKRGGITQQTLSLTYDANSNVTSIIKS